MNREQTLTLTIALAITIIVSLTIITLQTFTVLKLKKKLNDILPDTAGSFTAAAAIGHITILLQKMSTELVDGDFRLLIAQANLLNVVKSSGEFSFHKTLTDGKKKVIFTPMPTIAHKYGK
jgi:hypothetical protein